MIRLFLSTADLGGYLFRITDNGGATADRYTVIFSDGDYLGLSGSPSHPQGFSQWGESIDVANVAERVEEGEEVDLSWGCLPEQVRGHILSRLNEGWADYLATLEAGKVPVSREAAEVNEGIHSSGGVGIYRHEDGKLWVRLDGSEQADDRGPYDTAREALLATLPDHYSLAGPEYHSTCVNDGPQTETAHPEIMAAVAALEARVEDAEPERC